MTKESESQTEHIRKLVRHVSLPGEDVEKAKSRIARLNHLLDRLEQAAKREQHKPARSHHRS
jgi:hypothetical protein